MDSGSEQFGNESVRQNNSRTSIANIDTITNGTVQEEEISVWGRIKKVQCEIEKTTSKLTKLHTELKELIQTQENSTKSTNEMPPLASPEQNAIENGKEPHPPTDGKMEVTVINNVNSQEESQEMINAEETSWLTEVRLLKSPYYPQIDDLVVYFPQGYQIYLNAVKKHQMYDIGDLQIPFIDTNLASHQFVKVASIKYENYPPRVSRLTLQPFNGNGEPTGDSFEVRYHNINEVADFLVPKQMYDAALLSSWRMGYRCMCAIGGEWHFGCLESIEPYDSKFPNSLFKRYRVKLEDGKEVKLSPWELEPIDSQDSQCASQYKTEPEDWFIEGKEVDKGKILERLQEVMKLSIAKPFLHLNKDDSYASFARYPIDLSTILQRFENNFYRRVNSLKFDIEQLAANIEEISKNPNSVNVLSKGKKDNFKNYKIIHEILLSVVENPQRTDVYELLEQLEQDEQDDCCSTYEPSDCSQETQNSILSDKISLTPKIEWISACKKLFDRIWNDEGSKQFREYLNPCETKVTIPMNLINVQEYLKEDTHYVSPTAFSRDMNCVFASRKYLGEHAKFHGEKLKKIFNEEMDKIILSWKANCKLKGNTKVSDKSPTKRSHNFSNHSNKNGNLNSSPIKRSRKGNEGESSGMQKNSPRKFDERNSESANVGNISHSGRRSSNFCDDNDEDEDDINDGKEISTSNQVLSFNFSTSEYLRNIHVKDHIESVIGLVIDFNRSEPWVENRGERLLLLNFILDNNDGVKVNCSAWELDADRLEKIIKRRRVIEIKFAKAIDGLRYNNGNVNYKIGINNSTQVKILKKNYRVNDVNIHH